MSRLGAALAVARAARWERRNTLWRFSRLKAGAWLLFFQIAVAGIALYNSFQRTAALPLGLALSLTAAMSALWGAFSAYLHDRDRLYRSRLAELVHISPAPAHSLLLGNLLADLPSRAWTGLLWATVFYAPARGAWWHFPLLWLASLLAAALAQVGATLILVAATRRWPAFLVWSWALALTGVLGVVGLAAYALARPEALGSVTERLAPVVPFAVALLALAGGAAAAWVALHPERLGALYRETGISHP